VGAVGGAPLVANVYIRRARASDAAAIADIYRDYVLNTRISFEIDPPTEEEIGARIARLHGHYPWLVAIDAKDAILGYTYASQFRERLAYRFAVETAIYLAPGATGRGVGTALYTLLAEILTAQGFIHAIGALTLPNAASVALHLRSGFVETGVYRDVGYKLGEWSSVALFQKSLNPLTAVPAEPLPLIDVAAWQGVAP
jgi:phosphinothricin acetyltransferase